MTNLTRENAKKVLDNLYDLQSAMQLFFDRCSDDELHAEHNHLLNDFPIDTLYSLENIKKFSDKVKKKIDNHFIAEEKREVLEMIMIESYHLVEANKISTTEMLRAVAARCEHLIKTDF